MCCSFRVSSTSLVGAKGFIEATIDGLTFHRSKSAAAIRNTPRTYQVEWAQITDAGMIEPKVGKAVVWVTLRRPGPRMTPLPWAVTSMPTR